MKLETEIRNIINETIGGKYIGKLKVDKEEMEDGDPLWSLFLYLEMDQIPLVLAYQGTENEFKKFIREEIKSRKLHYVQFWTATREPIEYE